MTLGQNALPLHPVAKRLDDRGITTIAIIDDAFDPPVRADVATTVGSFWTDVEAADSALAELNAFLGREITSADAIDDAVVGALWNGRQTLTALRPYFDRWLAPSIEAKLHAVSQLHAKLANDLGRKTATYGKLASLPDTSAQMIFVDYYMGPGRDETAVKAAKDVVTAIDELYKGAPHRPLLVLMSSATISPEMIDDFRERSGWLAGMFYFISKDEFENNDRLYLKLATLAYCLPAGYQVQKFVDALASRIHTAAERFIKDVKALNLEDYAYIQKMSLQEDGHPLGDYMLWLYSAYFGHLLFDDEVVRTERREMDKLVFDGLPPSQATPSHMLAEIYKSATVDSVESDLAHPRGTPNGAAQPNLHLGDVFLKDAASEPFMILNAQCDLAFTPDSGHRPFKPTKTVLLIPGKLQKIDEPITRFDADKPRTEVFDVPNEKDRFRILWDTKRVRSVEHGDFTQWLTDRKYKLVARLRLPFALQVQQAFAADLTRVGMPVAPPIHRTASAQLCCQSADGKTEVLVDGSHKAFLFVTRDGEQCVLKEDFVVQIREHIIKAADNLDARAKALQERNAEKKTIDKLSNAANGLRQFADNHEALLLLRGPFRMPEGKDPEQLKPHPVCALRGGSVTGSYRFEQPLLLQLTEA